MNKLSAIFFTIALLLTSCEQFDDIWDKLYEHEQRIEQLEKQCRELNSNIDALQVALTAIQQNDYVTEVMKIVENGIEVGYKLTFAKSGAATIYHGRNGIDGTNGNTPGICVKKASDGVYYWTSNGEWLTNDEGYKIPATVADPDGGYIVPMFRIAEDVWYISYDNGNSWRPAEQNNNNGNSFFKDVQYDEEHVYFTLPDDTKITIPLISGTGSYWAGKKMVVNGTSIPYGSGLASVKDAFPYLVAGDLGMSIINYSIGGTTIAKRSGDYDECYISWNSWTNDRDNGLLDTSKKYLVNTGKNAPRIYQIYSHNGSEWVAGGNASTKAGRTPLSDRIAAMDKDADVVMIMAGSNDFYYNWAPFGNFEDGTYRNLGYTGNISSDNTVGHLDMSVNLIKSNDVTFGEDGISSASFTIDLAKDGYFHYGNIPVKGGRAVKVPYGRRSWWLDADGDPISTINFTTGTSDFTAISPDGAAYLWISYKYEEIDPSECAVYMSVDVSSNSSSPHKASNEPNETFYDSMHKLCRYLRHTYPKADIIFLTPIKRVQQDVWDCVYPEDKNTYGKTLDDYRQAIIKCCEYYSINYIDLYTVSGLNPHIDPSMFSDTGKAVHPNEEGHKKIASIITAHMKSMR